MIEDLDIWGAAMLLIDESGEDALVRAVRRVDALLEAGDIDGAEIWRRVAAAIEELRRGPGERDPVH
jgi:hypothetical protein